MYLPVNSKINIYNSEHYPDPTAAVALNNVTKNEKVKLYRPLVYICSPLRGDVKNNIQNACRYSKFAVEMGVIPLAPHLLYTRFMDDINPAQRELAMFFGMVLLGKCEAIWVFGNRVSQGMHAEIAKAKKHNMPIRYFNDSCVEVNVNEFTQRPHR